jgi:predicted lipopolysaccharide heptosyltransferase III
MSGEDGISWYIVFSRVRTIPARVGKISRSGDDRNRMESAKRQLLFPGAGNILLVQLGDIGDVVLTTPSLRAIRESYPGARLSILVRRSYGSLLAADPCLDEILEVSKGKGKLSEIGVENLRLVRQLRGARYDLVVDLRTGDRGAILSWLTGTPVRVVRRDREAPFWHDLAFTHPVDLVYADRPVHPGGDQSLRILRAIGVDTADARPRLHVSEADRESVRALLSREGADRHPDLVTVNPFSRWKYKEWDHGKWADVLNRLWTEHGLPSAVIGSREEAGAAAGIVGKCSGPVFNLAGKTTLGELAALISRSRLHVGVDSAAPHIAAAVGTPTVTIFGPSNWKSWVVEDETHRVARSGRECVPCNDKGCDGTERSICLEELGADTVMIRIGEVLRNLGSLEG